MINEKKFGVFTLRSTEFFCEDCLQKIYEIVRCPSGIINSLGFEHQSGDAFCITCYKKYNPVLEWVIEG